MAGPSHEATPYIDLGRAHPVPEYLRRMWRARDFILYVPLGQLRAQTHNTVLGGIWHLLNPLLHAALYYVVFGVLFQAARAIENYAAFLIVGMFAFLYTTRTVMAGAKAITGNLNLISQIRFPRAALPVSGAIAETISHVVAVAALLGIVGLLGEPPSITWVAVPAIVVVQFAFNLGLAFVAARLVFHFRDIDNLLPHVLRFWMYLSGLFFSVDFVIQHVGADSPVVTIFEANPGYLYMELLRGALLSGYPLDGGQLLAAAAWAMGSLLLGFFFFRSREVEYSSA